MEVSTTKLNMRSFTVRLDRLGVVQLEHSMSQHKPISGVRQVAQGGSSRSEIHIERIKLTSPEADEWLHPVPGTGGLRAFQKHISGIRNGTRDLWAVRGPVSGVLVTGAEDERLFVYYLRGEGLYGRVKDMARQLRLLAHKQGLTKGLACVVHDPIRAALFLRSGARIAVRKGNYYELELD